MGLGLIALSSSSWPVQVVAIFALFGCAFYFLHGVIQIFVTELAPSARARRRALTSSFFFLGQSIGPIYYRVGSRRSA